MKNGLMTTSEVSALIGCSVYTLSVWYRFKKENPDNEYAKMLPEPRKLVGDRKKYWDEDSIYKLVEFKNKIPHGRNGILGSITQKYAKRSNTQKEKIHE